MFIYITCLNLFVYAFLTLILILIHILKLVDIVRNLYPTHIYRCVRSRMYQCIFKYTYLNLMNLMNLNLSLMHLNLNLIHILTLNLSLMNLNLLNLIHIVRNMRNIHRFVYNECSII